MKKKALLFQALEIAKNIKHGQFKFGYGIDDFEKIFSDYKYVYYFEIAGNQVSFHSDLFYEDIPEFKGKWIGKRNKRFPFDLRRIKPKL